MAEGRIPKSMTKFDAMLYRLVEAALVAAIIAVVASIVTKAAA